MFRIMQLKKMMISLIVPLSITYPEILKQCSNLAPETYIHSYFIRPKRDFRNKDGTISQKNHVVAMATFFNTRFQVPVIWNAVNEQVKTGSLSKCKLSLKEQYLSLY